MASACRHLRSQYNVSAFALTEATDRVYFEETTVIQNYRGWAIQLIEQNNTWQVSVTSPDGMSSGIGALVGDRLQPEGAIAEAQRCIDRHLTWSLLRSALEEMCDRGVISWQEWENLAASLTAWAIQAE